ncbi:MAG: TIGR03668 family PPOX class F420-dependent oxidoreductase [Proteobacteria bacterium]|nr:TIGR03668 family PPOX class F420-dependent oxidoreductase [Pseudomonadota bacterium]MDA1357499.1 TIGR03668 family PPOX class F420-dependent oxidoreductase [Pseudomonadota bacterium]
MLKPEEAAFLDTHRVARLATADKNGTPHLVPVCFVRMETRVYITIDQKPKLGADLKRLRNIAENPSVALTVDHYDDVDWSKLGWLMVRGQAVILTDGSEHGTAQERLCGKYPQLRNMQLAALPVIAIQMRKVTSWGNLTPPQ